MAPQQHTDQKAKQKATLVRPKASAVNVNYKPTQAGQTKAANWLNRTVQGYIGGVGDYASGFIYKVGDGINGIGSNIGGSVTGATRSWGQTVAGYGNGIKDAVDAGGSRATTAGNPLGLAGSGSSSLTSGRGATASKNKGAAHNPLGL